MTLEKLRKTLEDQEIVGARGGRTAVEMVGYARDSGVPHRVTLYWGGCTTHFSSRSSVLHPPLHNPNWRLSDARRFPFAAGFEQIEHDLSARPRGWPSEQLRERCLSGLQPEFSRQRAGSRWTFAIAVAATLLVGLNLAISACQGTNFGLRLDGRQHSVEKTLAEIRRLLPEIPPGKPRGRPCCCIRALQLFLARTCPLDVSYLRKTWN